MKTVTVVVVVVVVLNPRQNKVPVTVNVPGYSSVS